MASINVGKVVRFLRHSLIGKIILVAIVLMLITSATATVYTFFYANNTATVQTPDIKLIAGSDASSSCTVYPCATVVISGTSDTATIGLSFFPANTGASPVPATYYSDLLIVQNAGTASHSIKSVQIFNVGGTTADLGSITVYFCTAQTEFAVTGALVTPANCVGNFAITSSAGGSVSGTFPSAIAAGTNDYIEIAAYASSAATAATSVTFSIGIQWL